MIHYSLPGEIDQQIADIDKVIKTIEEGNNTISLETKLRYKESQ